MNRSRRYLKRIRTIKQYKALFGDGTDTTLGLKPKKLLKYKKYRFSKTHIKFCKKPTSHKKRWIK